MKFRIVLVAFMVLFSVYCFSTPAHPLKTKGILKQNERSSEKFGPHTGSKRNLPQNILVLMCNFTDVKMVSEPSYPDSIVHDEIYFTRYMKHLKNFWLDASHEAYNINFTVHPEIIELNNTMGYYGDDSIDGERRPQMMKDVINLVDPVIDFNQYDAFILFHAGGGQESDINNTQSQAIWSTFLSRSDLREYFDKDNMNYQGIATNDGKFISEMVICPESQRHPDFPVTSEPITDAYIYDIMGVLAHQFGHQIGLPTLFDNDSSNGSSAGIGDFGLMGTAVWNNNGKIPALPCAWARYYMGWENAQDILTDQTDLKITYPMANFPGNNVYPKLYKIPISDKEYFLIENRQQNFIKDSVYTVTPDVPNGYWMQLALHTFTLAPPEIQDYYPDTEIPMVNMMENNLKGSEWDYFLPYMDAQTQDYQDGSGILIWHIDENIIDQTFSPDFEINHPNGDALHKGVDLEEADGIQHLDSPRPDYYMRGSPYDSYRLDNKNYFGKQINPFNNSVSLPTSDSYYGGQSVEIFNISESADVMNFSVRFNNQIKFEALSSHFSPFVGELQHSSKQTIYFDDGATLYYSENDLIKPSIKMGTLQDSLYNYYTFNKINNNILIPVMSKQNGIAKLFVWDGTNMSNPVSFDNQLWASHPISISDTLYFESKIINSILPLNNNLNQNSELVFLSTLYDTLYTCSITNSKIVSNLTYKNNTLHFIIKKQDSSFALASYNMDTKAFDQYAVELSADKVIALMEADFTKASNSQFACLEQTTNSEFKLHCFKENGVQLMGFPVNINSHSVSIPLISDVDNNSFPDILVGTENGYVAYAYNGTILNGYQVTDYPDSTGIAGGFISLNKENKPYQIGTISHNRLAIWRDELKPLTGYPISFSQIIHSCPFPYLENNKLYLYNSGEKGFVYSHYLQDIGDYQIDDESWLYAYGSLDRHASWVENAYVPVPTSGKLIKAKTFVYPSPWNALHSNPITIQVTTTLNSNAKVKIYDIAGNLVYSKNAFCSAFISNKDAFVINPKKMSSGVYFAVVSVDGETMTIKFAIEK